MKAVIMCGGMGTRMLPITELLPKPMLKIGGRPILDILLDQVAAAGAECIYITLGYKAQVIEEYLEEKKKSTKIVTVFEEQPLGTAGGVRHAVGVQDEDVLVVSGDNIFSFDLNDVIRYHRRTNADITLVGTKSDDPRDFGTVCTQDDGKITGFVEKPSWAQVQSDIINTGIYVLKGEVLENVPDDTFFDFSNDLFPLMMQKEKDFRCFEADGKWGDLGDTHSYIEANQAVLRGEYATVCKRGKLTESDVMLENGSVIFAPCLIGNAVEIGENCKIGPCSVISDGCTVADACEISGSIIGEMCTLGRNVRIDNAFIGDHTDIGCGTTVGDGSVLAGGLQIGKYVTVEKDTKIWSGSRIADEEKASGNVYRMPDGKLSVTAGGVSGKAFDIFSPAQALAVGAAIASASSVSRIGLAYDSGAVAELYKNILRCGMQSCGKTVYDFGELFRAQRRFVTFYCGLDFFVYVSLDAGNLQMSFSGKDGAPVTRKLEREIASACRYGSFKFADTASCSSCFCMNPLTAVYKSVLVHSLQSANVDLSVAVECDNQSVFELLTSVFIKKGYRLNYGGLLFIIDKYAEKFYAVENERAFSYDRILTILCMNEFLKGESVAVDEEAPGVIDLLAKDHGVQCFRMYEGDAAPCERAVALYRRNKWSHDALFCITALLDMMTQKQKSLAELSDSLPACYMKHLQFDYEASPLQFRTSVVNEGALPSESRNGYYEWEDERGVVRVKPLSDGHRVRVLVEAQSMEMSRELAADAQEKIKKCGSQKLLY